jgi:hypothetical protein
MTRRDLRPRLEMLEGKALLSTAVGLAHNAVIQRATPSAPGSSVVATLTTDRRVYHPGQPVVMTLKESNPTNHSVSIGLGPSMDGFYVSQRGSRVWSSNAGIQPLFVMLEVIPPHGSITLAATWNGQANESPLQGATSVFQIHSQVHGARPVTIRILAH